MTRLQTLTLFILLHTALFTLFYVIIPIPHIAAMITLMILSGVITMIAVAALASLSPHIHNR